MFAYGAYILCQVELQDSVNKVNYYGFRFTKWTRTCRQRQTRVRRMKLVIAQSFKLLYFDICMIYKQILVR